MSAKGGQKEGFPGQRPKSRAKEGHDRAPSQKQGSLAAMGKSDQLIGIFVMDITPT